MPIKGQLSVPLSTLLNLVVNRRDFFQRNQEDREGIKEYYASLTRIYESCAFDEEFACTSCGHKELTCPNCGEDPGIIRRLKDERLRDRLVTGINDNEAKNECLKEVFAELTLDKTREICIREEASKEARNGLGKANSYDVNRLKQKSAYKQKGDKSQQQESETNREAKPHKACGKVHPFGECKLVCYNCDRPGHRQSECPQHKAKEGKKIYRIQLVGRIKCDECVPLKISLLGKSAVEGHWLPDTGADVSVIGLPELRKMLGGRKRLKGAIEPCKDRVS